MEKPVSSIHPVDSCGRDEASMAERAAHPSRRRAKLSSIGLALALAIQLVGCKQHSKEEAEPAVTPSATAAPTAEPVPPPTPPPLDTIPPPAQPPPPAAPAAAAAKPESIKTCC